jgi:hypothetical protein
MARWVAKCWLGSQAGYQECEVDAATIGGAKQQLQRIYGAEQIINLREVRGSGSSGGSSFDLGPFVWILLILFGIGLIVQYWYIALPIIALLVALAIYGMILLEKNESKSHDY